MPTCISLNTALSRTLSTRITWRTTSCTRYRWTTSSRQVTSWEWEWVRGRRRRSSMRWTWIAMGASGIKSSAYWLCRNRGKRRLGWISGQSVQRPQWKTTWKSTLTRSSIRTWCSIHTTTQLSSTERGSETPITSPPSVADSNPSAVSTSVTSSPLRPAPSTHPRKPLPF